jgi:hypothetical protein
MSLRSGKSELSGVARRDLGPGASICFTRSVIRAGSEVSLSIGQRRTQAVVAATTARTLALQVDGSLVVFRPWEPGDEPAVTCAGDCQRWTVASPEAEDSSG